MKKLDRRNFLRASGLSAIPALLPTISVFAKEKNELSPAADVPSIRFFGDGIMYTEVEFINVLQKINEQRALKRDFYGRGGAVTDLEKKFQEITGKEKAVFMPTGTMANQLAISVLSGENTKVFVQDTSHVYRDEADAAQSVHNKRLMPLANGQTYFTAEELQSAIEGLKDTEVFASGVGAVSIENPVRRKNEQFVPIEEIKKISAYCRKNNIKLHLDGARIHMAAAWSGTSIREYASYFDTVYISLYKYLGAQAGAILCGDKSVMDKMEHLIKIHGGTQFGNWTNAAVALYKLNEIEQKLSETVKRWDIVMKELNKIDGISIMALKNGTNTYEFQLGRKLDGTKFQQTLNKDYNILLARPSGDNKIFITVNESILGREPGSIIDAFTKSSKSSTT